MKYRSSRYAGLTRRRENAEEVTKTVTLTLEAYTDLVTQAAIDSRERDRLYSELYMLREELRKLKGESNA